MSDKEEAAVRVTCPCCGSALVVDGRTGVVAEWKAAEDPRKGAALKDADRLLREEKARVEARYEGIVQADKERGSSMERKFKEFLEKSQGEPASRPLRDVDLD